MRARWPSSGSDATGYCRDVRTRAGDDGRGPGSPASGAWRLFVDCTVGVGGHARALLTAGATRLVGIDRDPARWHRGHGAREVGRPVELVHGDYRDAPRLLARRARHRRDSTAAVSGPAAVSSLQLDGEWARLSVFQRTRGALTCGLDTSQARRRGPESGDVSERDLAT